MKSKYGIYKIGCGKPELSVASIEDNKKSIIQIIEHAKKEEVSVLVFPELCLSGYTSQDLFLQLDFSDKIILAVKEIAKSVPEDMICFVGGPFYYLNKLFNVSFAISKNKILGIVPKTYIPSYNEFYEKRWFSSANEANFDVVKIDGEIIPFGNDLIFDAGELKIASEICEDLWVINPPSNNYALNGANVICNLSASNEVIAKKEYRRNLVSMQSAKLYCAYAYSSCGFGESTQDLVFSGHQIIAENGRIEAESYDDSNLTIGNIDIQKINHDRVMFKTSFEEKPAKPCRFVEFKCDKELNFLPKKVNPYPFIVSDLAKRRERSKEIISLQAKGLATRLHNIKCGSVVIGVSGGLDSTLALLVINEAFDYLKLDKKNIHAISMPGFGTSNQTFESTKLLIEALGLTYKEISIKESVSVHLKDLDHPLDLYDVTYENAQARMRTMILMDYANKTNSIVVGTGDLSELALGFCTYNGDHMSMYGVNSSIPKSLVKTLIADYSFYHKKLAFVLNLIISTPISPELMPLNNGNISQKTEAIIGKYDLHDFFLYNFLRNGFKKEKIFELAKIAFPEIEVSYIESTLNVFFTRFFSNQFKRSAMPDGVKIGTISLSPRGDFRMASDIGKNNSFNN